MRLILKPMGFLSNISWGSLARYTWLCLGAIILFVGLGTFLVEPTGSEAFTKALPFMIFLSFPSGLGFFLVAWPFLDIYPPIDFSILWAGLFLVGYFQWFHIVPNLRMGGITTLSLAQARPAATEQVGPTKETVSHRPNSSRKRKVRMVHFDAAGRTPLERAFDSGNRKSLRRFTPL